MKNLCIIPVKEESQRLKHKNIRDFDGKPLFVHTLEHAANSELFNTIHVSTSSKKVSDIAQKYGHAPDFLRPDNLSQPDATLLQVCQSVIEEYEKRGKEFDNFCLLWATSPLREIYDITNSYAMLSDKKAEAVVGVCDYNLPIQCAQKMRADQLLDPVFGDSDFWKKGDDRIVCDNGSLCWVTLSAFKKHNTWLPPRTYGYHMPIYRSVDIDTEDDWHMMEYFYTIKKNAKQ